MTNFTVKNIPDDLYERLKASARLHHRSINREIIACMERSLKARHTPAEDLLTRVRRVRERLGEPWSRAEIEAAIDEGRG